MSRKTARAGRRAAKAANSRPLGPKTRGRGVSTLDPATEKAINTLFLGLLKRLGLTIIVMMLSSLGIITLAKVTRNVAVGVFFLSVLIGLLISFWRNVGKAFLAVKELGIQRLQQQRFADAVFALEHFHKLGNMGFDRDGEAHYFLVLAYLGSKQMDKAIATVEWLQRHRRRSPYAQQASDAVGVVMAISEETL